MPLGALFLCGQWRVFLLMSGATLAGVVLGGILTGSPVSFLYQMVYHAVSAFGEHDFQRQLVTEFQPFDGAPILIVTTALFLLWRVARDDWDKDCVHNPVFILVGMGWIMGFVAVRFWTDWGWPALAYWTAMEVRHVMRSWITPFDLRRLVLVEFVCLGLFLAVPGVPVHRGPVRPDQSAALFDPAESAARDSGRPGRLLRGRRLQLLAVHSPSVSAICALGSVEGAGSLPGGDHGHRLHRRRDDHLAHERGIFGGACQTDGHGPGPGAELPRQALFDLP